MNHFKRETVTGLTGCRIRQQYKLLWIKMLHNKRRTCSVYPLTRDNRVPEEILEESRFVPGLFKNKATKERFKLVQGKDKYTNLIPCTA